MVAPVAVIPYVQNRDVFISHIKYSLKDNLCKTLDFDCWVNDFMAYSESESILTEEPVLTNALLDRLLHHCHVININGPSYRIKDQLQYMSEEA